MRSLLASLFDDARLVSDGKMVVLWREADFGRESDAALAMELVSEIVQYRAGAMTRARAIPGSLYVPSSGPWDERRPPAVYARAATPVRIAPVNRNGQPVMAASAACGRTAPQFELELDGHGGVEGPLGLFPPSAAAAVGEVGPCTIDCDTAEVTLTWPSLETDKHRLVAGAGLISAFARTQSSSLYR